MRSTQQLLKGKNSRWWGLFFGILFGFLLQKGGVTKYDVIINQLLLNDFTVLKIMLTAVLTGMLGIQFFNMMGWISMHIKTGSIGMNVIGGLIFGVGFAVLGYCPGTIVGAIGNGYLDALIGGFTGMILGTYLFAWSYPFLNRTILNKGHFGDLTLPLLLNVNPWIIVGPISIAIIGLLIVLEYLGW